MILRSNAGILWLQALGYKVTGRPRIEGKVRIKIDRSSEILFCEGVVLRNGAELRSLCKGQLEIGEGTTVDNGVRIIARNSTVKIGSQCKIGFYSVLNGGGGITIGDRTSLYGFVYVQSSTHTDRGESASSQKEAFVHNEVVVGNECLVYAHSILTPGTNLPDNTTVQWHSTI